MASSSRGRDECVTDRISKLPDDINAHILGYLPICDAVRTCVLSKRWRYSWMKAVQLNLYYDDCEEMTMTHERFFRLVVRVLVSHSGPIHKCVFRPNWELDEEVIGAERDLDTWLRLLSTKDVKDLMIECHADIARKPQIPPSMFQCLGISSLTLGDCDLDYSIAFNGFLNLVSLDLWYTDVDEDMLEKVISKCPLEMLFMQSCIFYSTETDFHPCDDAINAPSLRVLNVVSNDILHDCYMKYTSNLRVGSFVMEEGCSGDTDISDCFDVLRRMTKIEVLTFGCRLHRLPGASISDIIPKKLPELLGNLKTLNLQEIDSFSVHHMSIIFCIIRSSPNLECLEILLDKDSMCGTVVNDDSLRAVIAYLEVEAKEEFKTNITSVTVTFERVHVAGKIKAEIALIDGIVSCCPALKNLVIKGPKSIKGSSMQELSRALERIGQASSNLNMYYSDAH